ncbi:MAG TPA: alpha/beta fold hydrolase [Syntrophomonadaceae bacterium]|nr:alpha/beta fold hydrolase [Syntrophomonadaceae bacterium]
MVHIDPQSVYQEAEPFFFSGNNIAILFIHGFTASPSELYLVAKLVHQESGATVSGVLLPGHGSHPQFLNQTTWQDWYKTVEAESEYLLAHYEKVYVVGLSLGGLLSMYLGVNLPEIKGVVSINPPIRLRNPMINVMAPVMQWVKPYFPKPKEKQRKLRKKGRFAYESTPVRAFRSMMELKEETLKALKDIEVPLLLIQSLADESVHPQGTSLIIKKVKTAQIELVELIDSEHVATMAEEDQENIASLIIKFMEEN